MEAVQVEMPDLKIDIGKTSSVVKDEAVIQALLLTRELVAK